MAKSDLAIRLGEYMIYLFEGKLFIPNDLEIKDGVEIDNFSAMLSAKRVTIKKVKANDNRS